MHQGREELELTPEQIAAPGAMQLLMIYDELLLVASRGGFAKYLVPIIIVVASGGAIFSEGVFCAFASNSHSGFSWRELPFYLIITAIVITIWLLDLQYLRRYRLGLPKRLRRAGPDSEPGAPRTILT